MKFMDDDFGRFALIGKNLSAERKIQSGIPTIRGRAAEVAVAPVLELALEAGTQSWHSKLASADLSFQPLRIWKIWGNLYAVFQ